ncbi:unnamed protein product [Haemonchus placei]|uniref:Uncharacterized protein n=1 Tax=Haemonchus placei TaxID=6290 RepID=A0A3P7SRR4_HAEPC|nr:unnamed protein product [Haemonchus placei]
MRLERKLLLSIALTRSSFPCTNVLFSEVLFKAKVKRVMDSTHEAFLSLSEGTLIDVTAIKYSDHTDLMEGVVRYGNSFNAICYHCLVRGGGAYLYRRLLNDTEKFQSKANQERVERTVFLKIGLLKWSVCESIWVTHQKDGKGAVLIGFVKGGLNKQKLHIHSYRIQKWRFNYDLDRQ